MVSLDADNPVFQQPLQASPDAVGGTQYDSEAIKVQTRRLNLHYGEKQALFDVSIAIDRMEA